MSKETKRILITGACGQIGTELGVYLKEVYGQENIVVSDVCIPENGVDCGCAVERLDVTDRVGLHALIDKYEIDTIYHLAALLSGSGEKNPELCWKVNIEGLKNVLDTARDKKILRVFVPSSIAAFGPDTPKDNTPQDTILCPSTMYGVTKVSGELLCDYYVRKYGLDVRGIRYPGIISSEVLPSGGTTDYAVEIFYDAIKKGSYTCFLSEDTTLPMMYLPDALRGTVALMQADFSRLKHHSNFNLTAFSFSPAQLAQVIKKQMPAFTIEYKPDYRQAIADSWPRSIDDSVARQEWDWKPEFDLEKMAVDMIKRLTPKLLK